jgi:hypothetical protein
MGSARAPLDGYGPCEVYGNVYYSSYTQSNNTSTWYWEIRYYGNGGGQWTNGTLYYSLGGFAVGSGTFTVPQSKAYDSYILLRSGYFTKPHSSTGYLIDQQNMAFSINGNVHDGIGSGTAYADPGSAPRIPKVPVAPPAATFVSSDADSITFRIYAPSDNGGSAIQSYSIYVYTKNPDGTFTAVSGWWSGASTQTKGDLPSGGEYYVQYRAQNGIGTGPWSPMSAMMPTEAGVYVSDGANWLGASPRVSDGTAWENEPPQISTGTAWEDPINV